MQVNTNTEKMFFSTVKLTTFTADGREGSGTAFFFHLAKDGVDYPLLITNKHVVDGTVRGLVRFHLAHGAQPVLGETIGMDFQPDVWSTLWVGHPHPNVDIAVAPVRPITRQLADDGVGIYYTAIREEQIPNEEQMKDFDVLEEVTFVGYPNGVWDSKNFLPVIRRGSTATPMEVDFEHQPQFLIDASVFGGSSGSPVFIVRKGEYSDRHGNLMVGNSVSFVGVIAEVFFRTDLNEIRSYPIPTAVNQVLQPMAVQREMIDLGVVFKARTVVEAAEYFFQTVIRPTLPQ
ncbi:trypsin-like peptidase domain-containing protein [Pseudomonas putida]|uniref:Serine protease n=1 Tax=Pseudomonas putida TaxID=303 RepID=A0AAW5HN50_PSEPU|nr:trypsin-like peptidase domain-containing protein [Pseudomonas putida]MCO1622514.1 serine protease [Pseudomonas putida]